MTLILLYNEAVELTKACTAAPTPDVDPTAVLCEKAKASQEKLRSELLVKVPMAVRAAAIQGKSSVDILSFTGSEKFEDDFSYLFLLKGPRDREQKYDLYRHGFVPLYDTLMNDVVPFPLTMKWVPGCNLNTLTLEWAVV